MPDERRASDGLTFEKWKRLVDIEVSKRVFIGCDDIPDVDYYSLWSGGDSPSDAAEYALDESGMTWRDIAPDGREACSDSGSVE